jgi:hypothetical protein
MEVGAFIETWLGSSGGRERTNFRSFMSGLCGVLGVPDAKEPASKGVLGTFEYEGPVPGASVRAEKAASYTGFIDLYKEGCFILEAKQSYLKEGQAEPDTTQGSRYDIHMRGAYEQARNYAVNIPANRPGVPFLIVCDIGRAFELYFDWAGNGRGFEPFPDTQSYRVTLDQLADEKIRDLLRGIWTKPDSVDPRKISADVTRSVAVNLANVSEALEGKLRRNTSLLPGEHAVQTQEASLFLMRILFCMFAEDVELLPKDSFKNFIERTLDKDELFSRQLENLWVNMGQAHKADRFADAVEAHVPYFNGGLFRNPRVFPLIKSDRELLHRAAQAQWKNVEPAIFGTMLEKALGKDRDKLGAHYTPRKYVEFLVRATFIDDLEEEWTGIEDVARAGKAKDALKLANAFHDKLAGLKILDPACGTGNFLYVSMELMLKIEARLIGLVRDLGGKAIQRIDPRQFFGLELNTGAAKITELVLWIGWLRQRMADSDSGIPDPVLATLETINLGSLDSFDSVVRHHIETVPETGLSYLGEGDQDNPGPPDWPEADYIVGNPPFTGGKDIRKEQGDAYAKLLWRANPEVGQSADLVMYWWNRAAAILTTPGTRLKRFGFVTTNSITQAFSRRVIAGYLKSSPERANPPGKSSLERANPPGKSSPERGGGERSETEGAGATGFNSVDQRIASTAPSVSPGGLPPPRSGEDLGEVLARSGEDFSEVLARSGEDLGLSIIMAVPDHPWVKMPREEKIKGVKRTGEASLKRAKMAAVRIAMTVAEAGAGRPGRLFKVKSETALDSDNPIIEFEHEKGVEGVINADLTIGADAASATALKANAGLGYRGMQLIGSGFIVDPDFAREKLGLGKRKGLEAHIRPYRNGRDLLQRSRGKWVIDLYGLTDTEVMDRFPEVYEHVRAEVYTRKWNPKANKGEGAFEGREVNNRPSYKKNWWIFGEPRGDLRPTLAGLNRYVATVETAKHRIFQFLDAEILPDNMLVVVGSDSAFDLGVLSSRTHVEWSLQAGGRHGMGNDPRYNKSLVFDPFPFPDASPAQQAIIAEIAERLDRQRKEALAETPSLTMTEIYNWRDKLAQGGELSRDDRDRATLARARIVGDLHQQLDAAVAAAYGWAADWKNGALPPSEIVTRLVTLNAARAAEEAEGNIRWLRPDYQKPGD